MNYLDLTFNLFVEELLEILHKNDSVNKYERTTARRIYVKNKNNKNMAWSLGVLRLKCKNTRFCVLFRFSIPILVTSFLLFGGQSGNQNGGI